MDRIQHSSKQPDKFGAGKHGFKDGDPGSGTLATIPGAVSFDGYQEEIVRTIEAAGMAPDGGDLAQLSKAIPRLIALLFRGFCSGRFEYSTVSQVRFARTHVGSLAVEIDGAVRTKSDADIVFALPTHLEVGGEAASTWYYCYLQDIAGVLTPKISVTPPVTAAPAKVGYHPVNTSWRYIGSFYNDASSNVVEFDEPSPGTYILRWRQDPIFEVNVGTAISTTYAPISLAGRVPATARQVLISSWIRGDSFYPNYVPTALIGESVTAKPGLCFNAGNNDVEAAAPNHGGNGVTEFWLPVNGGAPSIGYGMGPGLELALNHYVYPKGYRE